MRTLLPIPVLLAAFLFLPACAQEEEPVEEKYERQKAAIENKARAYEAQVDNEVAAYEAQLENEADALLNAAASANAIQANQAEPAE
jgi:hypothetical protein